MFDLVPQNQCALGLQMYDIPTRNILIFSTKPIRRGRPDKISFPQILQYRIDLIGIYDPKPDQVLEAIVAVKSAASLSDLDQPFPDLRCRSVYCDRVSHLYFGVRLDLVSGHLFGQLVICCAPSKVPWPPAKL